MPNALRLPQQNPTPVLEYAPVPPDDNSSPNSGNVGSLGLGSSPGLSEGSLPPPPGGSARKPPGLRCVKDKKGVARQTEDPMSPPCVPFFTGENGGATWQGVTKNEITVLIYLDVGCPNYECARDDGTYIDLDQPALAACPKTWPQNNPNRDSCDYVWIRVARAFNHFFNNRFQTYGRRVHFWAYMTTAPTENARRKDAAANYDKLHPFAVIDYATYFGNNQAYDDAMAARGVMVYTSRTILRNSYYRANAPNGWGFWPDVQHWAAIYSGYVCDQIKPERVARGRSALHGDHVGKPRKYGLFYTNDPRQPDLHLFAALVKGRLHACGIDWGENEATFPKSGFAVNANDSGQDQQNAVARFHANGVTTVLYLGGVEGRFGIAAADSGYYPEIILAGDLLNDNNYAGRIQEQTVWQNLSAVQIQLRVDSPESSVGSKAYRQAFPNGPADDDRFAIEAYRDYFMLFQSIQVAGPRLTPSRVDDGFHAIPEHESTDPYVASCFFDPNDYTCVKDAMIVWWDPSGVSPGDGQTGCFRMVSGGRRFLSDRWAAGRPFANGANDPCTGYDGRYQLDPRTFG
jgi:hypothetical protein